MLVRAHFLQEGLVGLRGKLNLHPTCPQEGCMSSDHIDEEISMGPTYLPSPHTSPPQE